MEEPQGPRRKTVSRYNPKAEQGTHVFDIARYSLLKGLGAGNSIRSATFTVGGYEWCIRFKPDGEIGEENKDYVAVYLDLASKNAAEVRALFNIKLVNPASGMSSLVGTHNTPLVFKEKHMSWGFAKLKKKIDLEASRYLQKDRLMIECNLTVILEMPVSDSEVMCDIQVPPSDLSDNLEKFLYSKKLADVTVRVKDVDFQAHKFVLAMRSPVFEAQLYGPMKDKRRIITVDDMEPAIFKQLLHYIYTDWLPAMDDIIINEERVKKLLVAADRYGMERMMLMCESILCKNIDADSVAATLALADQHHCNNLKDACIEFINSSDRIGDVLASDGYEHLKRACPDIFMDLWEKAAKSRKI